MFRYSAVKKQVCFNQKAFNVLQIKEINLRSIDIDHDCGQFIAKIITNYGKLTLSDCQTTKPGYEAFSVELGNKQVIKAELRNICDSPRSGRPSAAHSSANINQADALIEESRRITINELAESLRVSVGSM